MASELRSTKAKGNFTNLINTNKTFCRQLA